MSLFKKESTGYLALERVYLTDDNKFVREGDARASRLLSTKGDTVPERVFKSLKLNEAAGFEPLETPKEHVSTSTISTEEISGRRTRPQKATETR